MNTIVSIEFKRVQTFLFAVPRLADIVGANALLGETLRYDLPKLAIKHGACRPDSIPDVLSTAFPDDPIGINSSNGAADEITDNPKTQWEKGILARDGGHFRAHFKDEGNADNFAREALTWLRQHLPGLRCEIESLPFDDWIKNKSVQTQGEPWKPFKPLASISMFSLPMLQHCEEAGNGPASHIQQYRSESSAPESRMIGWPAKQRKESWQKFKKGQTHDLAAIMARHLKLPTAAETFEQLCDNDYMALIHADGNGLGKAMKGIGDGLEGLAREAAIESFFHRMRVTLRLALARAVGQLQQERDSLEKLGLQILMLGGDDLLIACRAPLALPLVRNLAQALADIQQNSTESSIDFPLLTIGVGVAIAKPSFPFYRFHDLAEELASSAKRLVRNMEPAVSVVDWAICSESWHGDLKDVRRASQLLTYTVDNNTENLVLSSKPYRILEQNNNQRLALQTLLNKQQSTMNDAARSQLRDLARRMRKGRRQADQALQALQIASPKTFEVLEAIGFHDSLWHEVGAGRWCSAFADWLEIIEIPRLQTEKNRQNSETMDDTGSTEKS